MTAASEAAWPSESVSGIPLCSWSRTATPAPPRDRSKLRATVSASAPAITVSVEAAGADRVVRSPPGVVAAALRAVRQVRPGARSELTRPRHGRSGSPDAVIQARGYLPGRRGAGRWRRDAWAADSIRLSAWSSCSSGAVSTCRQRLDRHDVKRRSRPTAALVAALVRA